MSAPKGNQFWKLRKHCWKNLNLKTGIPTFWNDFKKDSHEDFSVVITHIENVIRTQQLKGAIVGAFNPNIVSRIIGLSDKQKVTHTINSKEFKGFDFLPYTPKADESI